MKPTIEKRFPVEGFTYDPLTGEIFRKGKRCDSVFESRGYRGVYRYKLRVVAHRLAWRLYYGRWPGVGMEVDHRNRNPGDNRITNLRLATHGQNQANSGAMSNCKSGERGVTYEARDRVWRISVQTQHQRFDWFTPHKISAIVAARLIRRILHGEFAA